MRALIAIVLTLWLTETTAEACKCALPDLATAASRAGVAFVGTITKEHAHAHSYTYEVNVERVWKGDVTKTVEVHAGHGRGDCSRGSLGKTAVGTRWLFLATAGEPIRIRLCSGTRRATAPAVGYMTKKYGAPKSP